MLNFHIKAIAASCWRRATYLFACASLLLGTTGISIAQSADAPGVSPACASVKDAINTMICNDATLAERERTMAALLAASRVDATGRSVSQQEAEQQEWIKRRDRQCSIGKMRECLLNSYDSRLKELAVSAIFQAPGAALAELNRQNPKTAALYEAIYRYATMEQGAQRANVVAKLIEPVFEEVHTKPWGRPLSDVRDAHKAAMSDQNFSLFLDVASVHVDTLTLPCSAMIRRPGLIDALKAAYGGAIDGQLIRSDCMIMTPPLEAVDRLTKAAGAKQPVCYGTIRFSLGREYVRLLVAVRLHRMDLLEAKVPHEGRSGQPATSDSKTEQPSEMSFVEHHLALIREATTQLTTYYSQNFDVPPYLAREQATLAVQAIVSGAHHLCITG